MQVGIRSETIKIVKSTLPILETKGEIITKRMYEILFTKYPETKDLFKNAPSNQHQKLANLIYLYAVNIENIAKIDKILDVVAKSHVKAGVKPEHYPLVGESLLQAIKEILNPPENVLKAWEEAYNNLANVLIEKEKRLYSQLDNSI
ncbi:globin domain-containing protein [Sulfurisphaera ohwakuensis]|uniref:Nitric oxide dioxygenase n=1 Tax=Sulfurisphaera ohwakuensis TaxID=69656 RepID=A0A650CFV1_SULOH|nr:globin domain-containing protein [Sulfurisphaera ohwakuensis]MBB5254943.1 nitric oxide dioxygenase [Sulfurisphaera ohwakuensis]QGR16761.1 hypothetical protein D1869_05840 [Sulfurisphaera ohwakuensis]